jgi:hypothetical protein
MVCGNLFIQMTHCVTCDPHWSVYEATKSERSLQAFFPRIDAALTAALTTWPTPSGIQFMKYTLIAALQSVFDVDTKEQSYEEHAISVTQLTVQFLKRRLEDGTWMNEVVLSSFEAIAVLLDWSQPFYSGLAGTTAVEEQVGST